ISDPHRFSIKGHPATRPGTATGTAYNPVIARTNYRKDTTGVIGYPDLFPVEAKRLRAGLQLNLVKLPAIASAQLNQALTSPTCHPDIASIKNNVEGASKDAISAYNHAISAPYLRHC